MQHRRNISLFYPPKQPEIEIKSEERNEVGVNKIFTVEKPAINALVVKRMQRILMQPAVVTAY